MRRRADTVSRMTVRWIAVALALAVLGTAGGYVVGRATLTESATSATARPLPAVSPSYPVNEYRLVPDPGVAPLPTDLPLRRQRFAAAGTRLTAAVPRGWLRVPLQGPDWNFSRRDYPKFAYKLRVGIDAGDRVSVAVARESRISALEDAEANGDLEHVVVEQRTDDGFVATYIESGHLRVAVERWIPRRGTTEAFATIAATGREVDRAGLADLVERVAASARY